MASPNNLASNGKELMKELFDVQFSSIVTTRMLPVIYGLALVLAGVQAVYSVIWAFEQNMWMGFLWLVVIAPAVFLAVVTAVRVVLELVLAIFRLLVMMESLSGKMDTMAGQIDVIQDDLPRIQFWKPRRKADS